MKRFAGLFLFVSTVWGQASTPPPPVIRDAFVETNDHNVVRSMRLNQTLQVVVCKAEFDTWKGTTSPDVALYLNGTVLPKMPAGVMRQVTDEDAIAKAEADALKAADKAADVARPMSAAACAKAALAPLDEAVKAATSASAAADAKAAAQSEPAATKDAADKKLALNNAVAARNAAAPTASARYVFSYFLDSSQVGKAEQWLRLLEHPWKSKPVDVSLGLPAGPAFPRQGSIELDRINIGWFLAWSAFFAVLIYRFIRYAKTSDIIRDSGPAPTKPGPELLNPDGTKKTAADGSVLRGPDVVLTKTYSLAKTSMAMWTFIVAMALVFIFVVTWNENSLSITALTLIGISFGTTMLASPLGGPDAPGETKGFIVDLLSEEHSISFHRYQMVLFSIILAIMFIIKTAATLTMPDFDPTLLGLMGISSGTYLGFKVQGK